MSVFFLVLVFLASVCLCFIWRCVHIPDTWCWGSLKALGCAWWIHLRELGSHVQTYLGLRSNECVLLPVFVQAVLQRIHRWRANDVFWQGVPIRQAWRSGYVGHGWSLASWRPSVDGHMCAYSEQARRGRPCLSQSVCTWCWTSSPSLRGGDGTGGLAGAASSASPRRAAAGAQGQDASPVAGHAPDIK